MRRATRCAFTLCCARGMWWWFSIAVDGARTATSICGAFRQALEDASGASGKAELPVPATFLIDGNGTIRLAHVDVDYTRRLDPDDVIAALRELNGVEASRTNHETAK